MFYGKDSFPFLAELERHWQVICAEMKALEPAMFMPWPETHIYNYGWHVFGLFYFERRLAENCARCPETERLLKDIVPDLITAGFSVLVPGTEITPHHGYTRLVIRGHLGLVVPEDCALQVGDEIRPWRDGEAFAFDDTVEHAAWNRSKRPRAVLLFDFRRPAALA